MPLKYEKRLIAHLSHDNYEPVRVHELGKELRVEDAADFATAVDKLAEQGRVSVDSSGKVRLPSVGELQAPIFGKFKGSLRGFGFVILETPAKEGDVFIPPDSTGGALTGDRVRIDVQRDRRPGPDGGARFTGYVAEVVERKRAIFTGDVFKRGEYWMVQPDGREMADPIVVRDAEAKNVREGLKVAVQVTEYPDGDMLAEGVVLKVLGEAGEPEVETAAVIAMYDLPGEFEEQLYEDALELSKRFDADMERFEKEGPSALPDRLDYTGEFVLTIDPPDAKDYDDAISIRKTKSGWELAVHIADVGHFIRPGSALDVEAKERGNSTYLPRLVIPMLPETLSNGICSLQEGVLRFSKSAFMAYDSHGNCTARGVGSTIIKSRKRLTYLEAQALMDGDVEEAKKHAKTEPDYSEELIDALHQMNDLARTIEARRIRDGMITLDLPECVLLFDEEGRVIDAEREDDAYTHKLIEMFMVEANETAARVFADLGVPLLRRTHPEPTPGDSDNLRKAATVAGFKIPANPTREELQGLLNATRGTNAARAVHMAVLRTLTKAEYSPALVGHFALASTAYAHFTSPIRRYPDLTVHWALEAYFERTNNGTERPKGEGEKKKLGEALRDALPDEGELVDVGRHCSGTEERSTAAERDLRQFLVLQLLENHIGEDFPAVVTGVTPRGIFVQIDKYLADGMVAASDLPGDTTRDARPPRWQIDKKTGALVDANSGRSFKMGDLVTVRVSQIDLSKRQMDLVIADGASRAAGKAKPVDNLKLGGGPGYGGRGDSKGGGFGKTGSTKRSQRSKSRDRRKTDYRDDRKKKGKK